MAIIGNELPDPGPHVGIKLASALVHAIEFAGPAPAPEDEVAMRTALADPEVVRYLSRLAAMALLPVQRGPSSGPFPPA